MPIKHNLTKYDVLKDCMHKVAQKAEREYSSDDRKLKTMAVVVASFASGHSWRTHQEIVNNGSANFNKPEIKEEFKKAEQMKWKNVTAFDIREVIEKNISHSKFMSWLYYNVDKIRHEEFKGAWTDLYRRIELEEGIEERAASAV